MDLVHRTASASTVDASFDTLARTVGQRLPRRQALRLLAATLATGGLGTAALTDAAAKAKSRSHKASLDAKEKGGKGKGGGGNNGGTTVPPVVVSPPPPPIQQPQRRNCRMPPRTVAPPATSVAPTPGCKGPAGWPPRPTTRPAFSAPVIRPAIPARPRPSVGPAPAASSKAPPRPAASSLPRSCRSDDGTPWGRVPDDPPPHRQRRCAPWHGTWGWPWNGSSGTTRSA